MLSETITRHRFRTTFSAQSERHYYSLRCSERTVRGEVLDGRHSTTKSRACVAGQSFLRIKPMPRFTEEVLESGSKDPPHLTCNSIFGRLNRTTSPMVFRLL